MDTIITAERSLAGAQSDHANAVTLNARAIALLRLQAAQGWLSQVRGAPASLTSRAASGALIVGNPA